MALLICRFLTLQRGTQQKIQSQFHQEVSAALLQLGSVGMPPYFIFNGPTNNSNYIRGPQKISQTRLGAKFSRAPRQKMITRASEGGSRERRWMAKGQNEAHTGRRASLTYLRSTAFLSSTHGLLLYIETLMCLLHAYVYISGCIVIVLRLWRRTHQ